MFRGRAQPLTDLDWLQAVQRFNDPRITEAHLRAVVEVEANGRPFNSMGIPTFLFEPHVFYDQLSKAKKKKQLQAAIKAGVAYPNWAGPGTYPKTVEARWAQFQKAYKIDAHEAVESTSWGMPQVMGYNYSHAGYSSAEEMVTDFADSAGRHLLALVEIIKSFGLVDELAEFPKIEACARFALRYNGKGYRKNAYHTKLASAYKRWENRTLTGAPMSNNDGVLRLGDSGPQVKHLQELLDVRGYEMVKYGGKYDGKFGPNTRAAVLAWQADNDRPTDGSMDALDMQVLATSPHRPVSVERTEVTKAELVQDSPTIQKSDTLQKVAVGTAATVGAAEVADQTGLLDHSGSWSDKLSEGTGIFYSLKGVLDAIGVTTVIGLVRDHPFIVIGIICLVVYYFAGGIIKERIKAFRQGGSA